MSDQPTAEKVESGPLSPESAVERVREFLRIVPIGRPYVGDGAIANVSGIGSLTIADLRTLLDMAERPAIDADHLASQRAWSEHTFGPGTRLLGVLDHIRKELAEIEAAPQDVEEWVDVIILAFDGAWRAGWEPQQIIDAIKAKQAKNEARTWPDWRSMSADRAIEHIETEARDAE